MDDPNTSRTIRGKGSSAPRRYRVTVRGDAPANLVDVVSSAQATALAYTTAHALALEGNEHSTLELDEAGDGESPSRSQGEVHHE